MQSPRCFVLITVSLLVAFTCIDRHLVFVNCLGGQLPAISALLAIGCLQPPSSLARHASSASLQLLHHYTSVLVGVALFGHHPADAKFQVVTERNIKDTSYYGSPVSLQGKNILIELGGHANNASITWRFSTSKWYIVLDKCNDTTYVQIEISDACKWGFVWQHSESFTLRKNDESRSLGKSWGFKAPTKFRLPATKLRIEMTEIPSMDVDAVTTDKGEWQRTAVGQELKTPDYCMLLTDPFSVNITITEPKCPIKMDAELLYDFYEPTTMTATPLNDTWNTTTPLWNGTSTSLSTEDPTTKSNILYYAIGGGVLGLLLLAAVGGLIAFFCIRRRRRPQQGQGHFNVDVDDDPNLSKQVVEKEGLIEWEDAMAHAAYEPKPTMNMEDWAFAQGDTVDLSTINQYELYKPHYKAEFKGLEFLADVKGNLDYGVCTGMFDPKEQHQIHPGVRVTQEAVIYYSFPPDRVKAFLDRLKRLAQKRDFRTYQLPSYPVRVPELMYFWISSEPAKCSYLVVQGHCMSVAEAVKDRAQFYRRVGWVFTTFEALASIHQLGCVHRDVTPAAFVIRLHRGEEDSLRGTGFVYITHLSLSRFQYNPFENTWLPRRRHVKYFGTYKYASRAAHAQQERSFKDDLESWFYTAVELIWPTKDDKLVMPWDSFSSEIGVTDRAELHKKYHAAKDKFLGTFDQNKLIVTFPAAQFRKLAGKIQTMTFEDREAGYKSAFTDCLYEMVEQLPAQADEANHEAVFLYMEALNDDECYAKRKFEFKSRNKSGSGRLPPAPTDQDAA